MIDPKGYIVTNAHVIGNSTVVIVQNSKGHDFNARIVYISPNADLAFLKIVDSDYKAAPSLPYAISKGNIELGEAIFTLGYPRDEIVYGEGYLSAKTGYRGDTLACQIAIAANPGNSGGPVIDKNGEVIGVLSNRQSQAQGEVFALRSKSIYYCTGRNESRHQSGNHSCICKFSGKEYGPCSADQKDSGFYLPGKKLLINY